MKYEGEICDICGKPVIEGENNIPTEKLVGVRKFGNEPYPYVEVSFEIEKITVGCFSDTQEPGGKICLYCLCDLLKSYHHAGFDDSLGKIPFENGHYVIPSSKDGIPY